MSFKTSIKMRAGRYISTTALSMWFLSSSKIKGSLFWPSIGAALESPYSLVSSLFGRILSASLSP